MRQISVGLDEDVYDELEEMARSDKRSVSSMARIVIDRGLNVMLEDNQ